MMVRMSLPLDVLRSKVTMLRKHADLPAVEVVKGLHQVLCAPAPAAQLGDHDCVNFVIASERHDLATLNAIIPRS
jgi:hypothetical protein